jgi:hypothetical protein
MSCPGADAHDVRRRGFVQFGEGALEVVAGGGNAHVRILSLCNGWRPHTSKSAGGGARVAPVATV